MDECKHELEKWEPLEEEFRLIIDHIPYGRCTGCGQPCNKVYPNLDSDSCEVCLCFKPVQA